MSIVCNYLKKVLYLLFSIGVPLYSNIVEAGDAEHNSYYIDHPGYSYQNPAVLMNTQGLYSSFWEQDGLFFATLTAPFVGNSRFGFYLRASYDNNDSVIVNEYGYESYVDDDNNYTEGMGIQLAGTYLSDNSLLDSVNIAALYEFSSRELNGYRSDVGTLLYFRPQMTGGFPSVLGLYTTNLLGTYNLDLNLQTKISLPSKKLSLISDYSVYGDSRPFEDLDFIGTRKFRRLGIVFEPVPWLAFTWSRLIAGVSEYRLNLQMRRNGIVSSAGIEFFAIRGAKDDDSYGPIFGLQISAGLFGGLYKDTNNRNISVIEYYSNKRRQSMRGQVDSLDIKAYNEKAIGYYRGAVIPAFMTWSVVGTFLTPAGSSNLVVGNYLTGLIFLGGEAAFIGGLVAGDFIDIDDRKNLSLLISSHVIAKIVDYFISQDYVERYNNKIKVDISLIPGKDEPMVEMGATVAF